MFTLPFINDYLRKAWHLYLLDHITARAALAAITAFAFSILLGPALIRWLTDRQIRERVDKKDSERLSELHRIKANTPTQGGLLIAGAIGLSVFLWGRLENAFVALSFVVLVGSGAIGYLDDQVKHAGAVRKGLTKWEKLALQFLLYGIVATALFFAQGHAPAISVPFMKRALPMQPLVYCAWGAFVLALASNAVNLTDGLDGLAAGCSAMTGLALGVVAYAAGHRDFSRYLLIPSVPGCGELAVVAAALVGACLGFLWFNCYPAEVFMGDTGSLTLGGLLGYLAFSARQELVLLLLGGIFMAEVASVVLQVASFRIFGRRIFKIAPIHHHFEFTGWHEAKVTVRFWILAAVLAMAIGLTLKLH